MVAQVDNEVNGAILRIQLQPVHVVVRVHPLHQTQTALRLKMAVKSTGDAARLHASNRLPCRQRWQTWSRCAPCRCTASGSCTDCQHARKQRIKRYLPVDSRPDVVVAAARDLVVVGGARLELVEDNVAHGVVSSLVASLHVQLGRPRDLECTNQRPPAAIVAACWLTSTASLRSGLVASMALG